MYMYVRMCMYMYPCIYVCVCVCICVHIYVYACMSVYVYMHMCIQSWMTIKKTEISAQHEFLKSIYLCVYSVTILKYLGVQEKC